MGVKLRSLDLGPITIQTTREVDAPTVDPASAQGRAADVRRFQALMNRHRGERDGRGRPGDDGFPPEAFLGSLPEAGTEEVADADDIGAEIAHLWIGTGLRSSREVRVGLRQSLLPDTQLRLREVGNRLRVEFSCGTQRVAGWLERRQAVLARELGERLGRDIEVAVFTTEGRLVCSVNWPEGARDAARAPEH